MREHCRSFAFVEVDQYLGIAVGLETMPRRFEPVFQFAKIVDFTVEDDPNRAVFVGKRLFAAGNVDDRKPSMS